jgi:3-deoxy-D-manno-octulosonic-acid transferase
MHDALSYGEKQTLNYILSTPELLKLIIQSPTAASAKVAVKYLNKIDKTNNVPLSHVVTCWKFLRLQHERQRKNNTN